MESFKWEAKALLGNKTVEQILTTDIDIRSEKIKLTKFLSEYDMNYVPYHLKSHPYLTLLEMARHSKELFEIPYTIIEDDLPKIKPRHYSITNDPFFDSESLKFIEETQSFEVCFTLH